MGSETDEPVVLTVGHSDRKLGEFLDLVASGEIDVLIVIRSVPNSSRFPHFSKESLESSLPEEAVMYEHWPELGGVRDTREDSQNTALKKGFQAVADHLHSPAGQQALDRLDEKIRTSPDGLAMMCAEKNPSHCHRTLISDHLVARDLTLRHLIDRDTDFLHEIHPHGRVKDEEVIYPGLV